MAEHRIRVISPPDVGGGFGPKGAFYPEEALVVWLSRHLRRPVKWIEDRYEHFVSAAQEREQVHTIEIAFNREGKLLGLRDMFTHDIGIYGALVAPVITACTVPRPYKIPNIHSELTAAYTNLQPSGAVRGAGLGHDCGNVINPLLVEGQIMGGVAHGLSNALYEGAVYNEQGQSLTTSFLDYPLPSAWEMPRLEIFHLTTPSPLNPLGVKGAGEAGTLPVPAAIANAVEDALRPFGVRVNRMPLNPARIRALVHGALRGDA
jgi:CO/xanthine dehydrogenase Mo-binding subunit